MITVLAAASVSHGDSELILRVIVRVTTAVCPAVAASLQVRSRLAHWQARLVTVAALARFRVMIKFSGCQWRC